MTGSQKFSSDELIRYSRHLNLPDFTLADQHRLKDARVLVVGAGGLGSPLLQYLVAAGVGNIGIVDYDTVDLSNLQRQVLYTSQDIGKKKAIAAKEKLLAINPCITIQSFDQALTVDNATEMVAPYDIIADGTDNFPTRYLINDVCLFNDKINVHASVFRYQGQVSVFNYPEKGTDGKIAKGPDYRDLFPEPPHPDEVVSCEEGGILGVLPGILGSIQALEVIKIILNKGDVLSGKLFIFDALSLRTNTLSFKKNPDNPISGTHPSITRLIDYEAFCGSKKGASQTITVTELKQWMDESRNFLLVDVRETEEYVQFNIGGRHLPLSAPEKLSEAINNDTRVVIHCNSGTRSAKAVEMMASKNPPGNLYNLSGGIDAWIRTFGRKFPVNS
ncbi:MAG: molybdopterin-synthase adenylyltransferase MoeB [Cyclobacteriaceae bacterium]